MENNTLTKHHIIPYLPFGLEVQSESGEIFQLTPYPVPSKGKNLTYLQEFFENNDKPLLNSLDDYSKWEKCTGLTSSKKVHNEIYDLAYRYITPDQCSYAAILAMAEAKIDMFRLIDAGLAVDYKSLK